MRTQGILFQGLYFSTKAEGSFLKEEFSYCKELQTETGHYIDVTYFLLYALCKNPKIRKMLEIMEKDWKEYILSSAEKSIYQRGAFWEYLNKGERENAQILLGLLEEIRNCHTSRAEKSWIAFAYLFHKSIGVEYSFLEGEKLVSFEKYAVWQKNIRKFRFSLLPIFVQPFSGQRVKILRYRETELMIFYIPV